MKVSQKKKSKDDGTKETFRQDFKKLIVEKIVHKKNEDDIKSRLRSGIKKLLCDKSTKMTATISPQQIVLPEPLSRAPLPTIHRSDLPRNPHIYKYPCRATGCTNTFKQEKKRDNHESIKHGLGIHCFICQCGFVAEGINR